MADVFLGSAEPRPIRFTHGRLRQSLGVDFPHDRVVQVLTSLGFQCGPDAGSPEALNVIPPYWRSDVGLEDDVVEEVARIIGYDSVPSEPLRGAVPSHTPQPERDLRERVKTLLVGGRTSGDHLLQPGESCHPRPRPSPRPWQT